MSSKGGENWYNVAAPTPSAIHREGALNRQQQLTKPAGSLGKLEQLAIDLAGLQACDFPTAELVKIVVFAADHGIAERGVSAFPQSVTVEMIRNFATGGAAISVLAKQHNAQLQVVNVGSSQAVDGLTNVLDRRIAAATADISEVDAMNMAQLEQALQVGADAVDTNLDIFIAGEMGIGNTTVASTLAAALLQLPIDDLVGYGTGIDATGLAHKVSVSAKALARYQSKKYDALSLMRGLGGFEIAAIVGAYIAAAQKGIPSFVDGFICSVAALYTITINPSARPYLLFSHRSQELGHQRVLAAMEAEPLLDLNMRLGEASGAAVAIPLLRSACRLHKEMATFDSASVSQAT